MKKIFFFLVFCIFALYVRPFLKEERKKETLLSQKIFIVSLKAISTTCFFCLTVESTLLHLISFGFTAAESELWFLYFKSMRGGYQKPSISYQDLLRLAYDRILEKNAPNARQKTKTHSSFYQYKKAQQATCEASARKSWRTSLDNLSLMLLKMPVSFLWTLGYFHLVIQKVYKRLFLIKESKI